MCKNASFSSAETKCFTFQTSERIKSTRNFIEIQLLKLLPTTIPYHRVTLVQFFPLISKSKNSTEHWISRYSTDNYCEMMMLKLTLTMQVNYHHSDKIGKSCKRWQRNVAHHDFWIFVRVNSMDSNLRVCYLHVAQI